jgi:hypothetical protein
MFLIVDEYPINAACPRGLSGCFICGAPRRAEDILVNLGVATDEIIGLDNEVYGSKIPVMCSVCIEELGALIGMLPAIKADQLLKANLRMSAQIERMSEELMDLESLKRAAERIAS